MPSWYPHESFIVEGYRRITNSWLGCLSSLTYWHNETGNVYTHMLGAFFVVPVSLTYFNWMAREVSTNTIWDFVVHATFLAGLFTCLAMSTVFHLCCWWGYYLNLVIQKLSANTQTRPITSALLLFRCIPNSNNSGSFVPTLYVLFD